MVERQLMYIGGKWCDSAAGWSAVEDPSTGEPIGEVPATTVEDVDAAVAAARTAFDEGPWPRLQPQERRDHLLRLHTVLQGYQSEIAGVVSREAGAPIRTAGPLQVGSPLSRLPVFAEQALLLRPKPYGIVPRFGYSELQRVPLGVSVGYAPFNFPFSVPLYKLVAIAMGNTLVLKPSDFTPLSSALLARACEEAEIPAGVVNVVYGGPEAGARLAAHPDVRKISFTGSGTVGERILAAAARGMKRVTIEAGGKHAHVVLPDADLDLVARTVVASAFTHAGQVCQSGSRVLCPRERHDELVERVGALTQRVRVGPAADESTDMGPLISAAAVARAGGFVAGAVRDGARVVTGGRRPVGLGAGHFYAATVLANVRPEMDVAHTEVFGPVLSMIPYADEEEAVAITNGVPLGLSSSVWTNDLAHGYALAGRIEAGVVTVNDWTNASGSIPVPPFKESGIGADFGDEGALEFTQMRHVHVALDRDPATRGFGLTFPGLA
jgi:aldehyde dehydrogenase (NAD+)